MNIQDPDLNFLPITDSGVKKAPARVQIRNTASDSFDDFHVTVMCVGHM
jgi:hypothetical protein